MQKASTTKFITRLVKQSLRTSFAKAFPALLEKDKELNILIQNGPKNECEYVSPSAMKYFNMCKSKEKNGTAFGCKTVEEFAAKVVEHYEKDEVIKQLTVHDKGFLRIKLNDDLIEEQVNSMMNGLDFPQVKKQKVLIDFSSPNIAKQMHVGHLRSTIIGQSMSRILQYMGNQVHRVNHVGDWGTQFGMLIAHMQQTYPDYEQNMPEVKDLEAYYKAARAKFDTDPQFKKKSQETVVKLQSYDEHCYKAWKSICEISRQYFSVIYKRLDARIQQFGQSFYNPMIPDLIKQLQEKNLIVEDDTKTKKGAKVDKKNKKGGKDKQAKKQQEQEKQEPEKEMQEKKENQDGQQVKDTRKAKCIFIEKYQIPLMVVKTDGGYGYDTTDLAAIRYRLLKQERDRVIVVTDLGQREHFEMIYAAARKAGWLKEQRAQHMGFGVVLEQDPITKVKKKFSTRKGVAVKLLDLIEEAKQKALIQLKSREKQVKEGEEGQNKEQIYTALKPEQYEDAAEKIGVAGIKYYDLKQNRTSDYVFDFDKILDPRGNTAVYLIYAYVRMCSIIRKSGLTRDQISDLCAKKPFRISHPDERILAGMLIKFFDVIYESADEMQINRITDFIYEIAVKIQENYKKYRIIGDENMESRIILCQCIRRVMEKAFYMVGIIPIEKI